MTRKTGWEENTWDLTPLRTCAHRMLHTWATKCFSAPVISLNRHGNSPQTCISMFGKWHDFESTYIIHLHAKTLAFTFGEKKPNNLPCSPSIRKGWWDEPALVAAHWPSPAATVSICWGRIHNCCLWSHISTTEPVPCPDQDQLAAAERSHAPTSMVLRR